MALVAGGSRRCPKAVYVVVGCLVVLLALLYLESRRVPTTTTPQRAPMHDQK